MHKISVLVVHNHYQQPGGEDTVVRAEVGLLRKHGHRVVSYMRHNAEIDRWNVASKLSLSVRASWNHESYRRIKALIAKRRPDVAHFHNFLPLVSPAAYYACRSEGVPVVQTLHNYRLICPAGTLFRNGQPCNRCTSRSGDALIHGCYRKSFLQTAAVFAMLHTHRWAGTWRKAVDAYIAPTQFSRDTFVRAGLPAERIHCRPNFLVSDPGARDRCGAYALFVGRLTSEKGVLEMLRAWRELPEVPLVIAGDGPLYPQAWEIVRSHNLPVKMLGHLDPKQTIEVMKGARFLVFPSRWHEPFGMALVEAAACALPAIASRRGGIPELVADQRTGLLFDGDNYQELIDRVRWAWSHPEQMQWMGESARQRYLDSFTAEASYANLLKIYDSLVSH